MKLKKLKVKMNEQQKNSNYTNIEIYHKIYYNNIRTKYSVSNYGNVINDERYV